MPSSNSDFGIKIISLTYDHESVNCSVEQKIEVFFDKKATNHPGGGSGFTPNWYYYWDEGGVVGGMTFVNYSPDLGYIAQVDDTTGEITLGPKAADSNTGTESLIDLYGNTFELTGSGKHIYFLAEVIAHEEYHAHCITTWGPDVEFHGDTDQLPDADEMAPEPGKGFPESDPFNYDSFGYGYSASYDDQEVRCRIIELNDPKTCYPEKDWSAHADNVNWR